ncbi:MAG: RNA polymerase factor sigma-54 [Gemmatimonadota bacterium]|nr:RNA polymerase factor sigma-54 [Gemmatimonadota bacterium]
MSRLGAKLHQSQQLRQDAKIGPRLYQAMELLYMPLLDLQQRLKQELAENPFLELTEADAEPEAELEDDQASAEEENEAEEELDWEDILLDGLNGGGHRPGYEEREFYQPPVVEANDLADHLAGQLRLLDLSERQVRLGEEIIGNIDDDGRLSCSLEVVVAGANGWLAELKQVARGHVQELEVEERGLFLEEIEGEFRPYELGEADHMLGLLQQFDPPGVAARDLRECILLQLRHRALDGSLADRLVREHFDELIQHRWLDIQKSLGVTAREVQDAADEIARLEPKPGLKYAPRREDYIIPDLVVDKIDGEYMVFVNDTSLPRLRLSRAYVEVARDRNKFKGENKEFISSKLSSANWMIQAVEQRRQTMLKVMNFIGERQRDFFEKGVQHLRPLTLREVADHIDMHESTVSRVTNEKFCQTPRGVYPLKFFFSSGLSTRSGEDISARGVRAKIERLVDGEDPSRPLTDKAIVELLESDGVRIARRTVAKYRDQLGILPARMRRRV